MTHRACTRLPPQPPPTTAPKPPPPGLRPDATPLVNPMPLEVLGGRWKAARERHGWSLRRAAYLTGIPATTLRRFERGIGHMSGTALWRLLQFWARHDLATNGLTNFGCFITTDDGVEEVPL